MLPTARQHGGQNSLITSAFLQKEPLSSSLLTTQAVLVTGTTGTSASVPMMIAVAVIMQSIWFFVLTYLVGVILMVQVHGKAKAMVTGMHSVPIWKALKLSLQYLVQVLQS